MFPWLLRLFSLTPYSSASYLASLLLDILILEGNLHMGSHFPTVPYLVSWWFQPQPPFSLLNPTPELRNKILPTNLQVNQISRYFSSFHCLVSLDFLIFLLLQSKAQDQRLLSLQLLLLPVSNVIPLSGSVFNLFLPHPRCSPKATSLSTSQTCSSFISLQSKRTLQFILRYKHLKISWDLFCFGLSVP